MKNFYTLPEIADQNLLPYSLSTLRRLVSSGKLGVINKGTGEKLPRYVVAQDEIERHLKGLRRRPSGEQPGLSGVLERKG